MEICPEKKQVHIITARLNTKTENNEIRITFFMFPAQPLEYCSETVFDTATPRPPVAKVRIMLWKENTKDNMPMPSAPSCVE